MPAENKILTIVVNLMMLVGEAKSMSGKDKKKFVLDKLRELIEIDGIVEDLIIEIIDLLIQVENGELVFNKKITSSCCFPF
jgi:hypothetical protein